jgi:hypothetical protein
MAIASAESDPELNAAEPPSSTIGVKELEKAELLPSMTQVHLQA